VATPTEVKTSVLAQSSSKKKSKKPTKKTVS
jgi:hypothetical protein